MRGERGTVLISVLWIVLVLSVVSFSLAASVRVESESVQQSFDSERAFFMAKSAAEIIFNAFSKNLPIPEKSPIRQEQGEYVFPFDSGEAHVRFESKAGLISLNDASDKTLAALFDSVGVDRETRNRLVDSILDWRDADDIPHLYGAEVSDYDNKPGQPVRPRNAPFVTVDELLLVKNMTAEIFFGSFVSDSVTGQYSRIPGVRELVAIRPGGDTVDPNLASFDVLRALPGASAQLAARINAVRREKLFSNNDDLMKRVPELNVTDAHLYISIGESVPTELVSRAVITSSGVTRTVRMLFKKEEKLHVITYVPFLYRRSLDMIFDRWRFE